MTNLLIFLLTITNWTAVSYERPVTNNVGWTNEVGTVHTQTWARLEWNGRVGECLLDVSAPHPKLKPRRKVMEIMETNTALFFTITNSPIHWVIPWPTNNIVTNDWPHVKVVN